MHDCFFSFPYSCFNMPAIIDIILNMLHALIAIRPCKGLKVLIYQTLVIETKIEVVTYIY